jgi:hypothetical protein
MSGTNSVLKPIVTIGGQEVGLAADLPSLAEIEEGRLGQITVNLEPMETNPRTLNDTSSFRDWRPLGLSITALTLLACGLTLGLVLILRGRARRA